MIPAAFEYQRAGSADEALILLERTTKQAERALEVAIQKTVGIEFVPPGIRPSDLAADLGVDLHVLARLDEEPSIPKAYVHFFLRLFSLAGNRPMELLFGALTEVIGSELEDYALGSGTADTIQRGLGKALDLAEKGDGKGAADYWTKQMLKVVDSSAQLHDGRTLVEARQDY